MSSANNGSTLGILNNVETPKVLVKVMQFADVENESRYLSQGSDIVSTVEQIAKTKKVNVLLPLLGGVKNVVDVLIEARDGAVKSKEGLLNEAILNLANEMITDPLLLRLRDGEVISFDQVSAYAKGMGVTIATAVDRVFYANLVAAVKSGVAYKQGVASGAVKGKITDASAIIDLPDATAQNIKDKGAAFANLLRKERRDIKAITDKFLQANLANSDFNIVINTNLEELLESDGRYNLFTANAQGNQPITTRNRDADLDGTPILYSKKLPADVAYIVMVKGSATSMFALRNVMNLDKVAGVNAYKMSVEFDEGTGVWLPHLITIGSGNTTTHPVQARVTFDALSTPMTTSVTQAGGTNAGLDAAKAATLAANPAPAPDAKEADAAKETK